MMERAEQRDSSATSSARRVIPSKLLWNFWMMNIRHIESVRRNLFGPVDHKQLHQELQLKLKEIMEQDCRRWNFDFQSETPQLGRFQWEEIPAACVSVFYQETPQPTVDVTFPKTKDEGRVSNNDDPFGSNQENCLSVSNGFKCQSERTPVRRKRSLSKPGANSKNARITGNKKCSHFLSYNLKKSQKKL